MKWKIVVKLNKESNTHTQRKKHFYNRKYECGICGMPALITIYMTARVSDRSTMIHSSYNHLVE